MLHLNQAKDSSNSIMTQIFIAFSYVVLTIDNESRSYDPESVLGSLLLSSSFGFLFSCALYSYGASGSR